jgi:hypothetical protein
MTATDLFWHVSFEDWRVKNDVTLLELTIEHTSDLLKDLSDLEGSYILGE